MKALTRRSGNFLSLMFTAFTLLPTLGISRRPGPGSECSEIELRYFSFPADLSRAHPGGPDAFTDWQALFRERRGVPSRSSSPRAGMAGIMPKDNFVFVICHHLDAGWLGLSLARTGSNTRPEASTSCRPVSRTR
jgi:hypothetical protein